MCCILEIESSSKQLLVEGTNIAYDTVINSFEAENKSPIIIVDKSFIPSNASTTGKTKIALPSLYYICATLFFIK